MLPAVYCTLIESVPPTGIGAVGNSGTVHPHVADASRITNGDLPSFLNLIYVSTLEFAVTSPKSWLASANVNTGAVAASTTFSACCAVSSAGCHGASWLRPSPGRAADDVRDG